MKTFLGSIIISCTYFCMIFFRFPTIEVKFIYSEKATIFCKISTVDLSYVVMVKSTVEISQNFVTFSEYMNLHILWKRRSSMHVIKGNLFNSEDTAGFLLLQKGSPNHYLEQKIWICCLLFWAGNSNFLLRIVIWNIFWRWKNPPVSSD